MPAAGKEHHMGAWLYLGVDVAAGYHIDFIALFLGKLIQELIALLVALRLLYLEVVLDVVLLESGDKHLLDSIGAVRGIENLNPG